MEIKTTGDIIRENQRIAEMVLDNEYSVKLKEGFEKKWVAVDNLIGNIKIMREIWADDNLNEEDFDNLLKELI